MKFNLRYKCQHTILPPELLEIYQPVLGYEAIAVWINIYHALVNGHVVSESDILQQMNITQKVFRSSINELKKYKLVEIDGDQLIISLPCSAPELIESMSTDSFTSEQQRRLLTLIETFRLKRGLVCSEEDTAVTQEPAQISEQLADEFATRFIKECSFVPNRQLRDRFDLWFEEIKDCQLLEELLERTKRKVQLEGSKGTCPSLYADKIVRQWMVQGIRTYADLMRHDQEFHARWEYYRVVEKELARGFNSLTPAEKEIIDQWIESVNDVTELSTIIKRAILSGEYQGKGAPSIAFIAQWLKRRKGKVKPETSKKTASYSHQHKITDLQKVIRRKTMIGLEEDGDSNEG